MKSTSMSVPTFTTPLSRGPWPRGTLLASLSPACRAEMCELGRPSRRTDGDALMREGERTTHVVLLLNGFVKITASPENGKTTLLGIRVSGDTVGEMAALEGSPRSATATACRDLRLRIISGTDFVAFLNRRPEAGLAFGKMICQRLRWANRRRTDFNGYPTEIRLARVLVELAVAYGHRTDEGIVFDVELTQDELGALAGADVDTAGRALRKFRSDQVIKTGYRRTVIRDLSALKALARLPEGAGDRPRGR